jgi:hypothetical protein
MPARLPGQGLIELIGLGITAAGFGGHVAIADEALTRSLRSIAI